MAIDINPVFSHVLIGLLLGSCGFLFGTLLQSGKVSRLYQKLETARRLNRQREGELQALMQINRQLAADTNGPLADGPAVRASIPSKAGHGASRKGEGKIRDEDSARSCLADPDPEKA